MYLSEEVLKKWSPVLDHADLEEIKDPYKKAVTAMVLENQQQAMDAERGAINETAPTNVTGSAVSNFDPILIKIGRAHV